jgi:geranylgeranyl diphosphate synthase, type II
MICAVAGRPVIGHTTRRQRSSSEMPCSHLRDDLLDVIGDASLLGKATGADRERAKPTYPAVIGVAASQAQVRVLNRQAVDALAPFGDRAAPLRALADWLLARRY